MVSNLDKKNFKSEFKFHWMPHSYGLIKHIKHIKQSLISHTHTHKHTKANIYTHAETI